MNLSAVQTHSKLNKVSVVVLYMDFGGVWVQGFGQHVHESSVIAALTTHLLLAPKCLIDGILPMCPVSCPPQSGHQEYTNRLPSWLIQLIE